MNDIKGVGELSGPTVPVWLWTDYMQKAADGMKVVDFPSPAHINPNAEYRSTPTEPSPTTSTRRPRRPPRRRRPRPRRPDRHPDA